MSSPFSIISTHAICLPSELRPKLRLNFNIHITSQVPHILLIFHRLHTKIRSNIMKKHDDKPIIRTKHTKIATHIKSKIRTIPLGTALFVIHPANIARNVATSSGNNIPLPTPCTRASVRVTPPTQNLSLLESENEPFGTCLLGSPYHPHLP